MTKEYKVQSNLSTTATLGTPKKWPLYRVGRSLQVFQSKLVLKKAWPDLGWPLLTGGRYSDSHPARSADSRPARSADSRPARSADSRPARSADSRPAGPRFAKPKSGGQRRNFSGS